MLQILLQHFIGSFFPFNILLDFRVCLKGERDSHTNVLLPLSPSLSLSLRLPRQAGQAEMSPTSISICIYPAHDPGLFTMLQEPQITPIITRSLTARRSRYQKINMLMYQPGVQSVTAQLYSHATCLADWIGPGAWHMTHTHSSLEES